MLSMVISIAAIIGLWFFATQSDGPWGIVASIRNALMANEQVGVFFYKLLDCSFCSGCWAGGCIYLLQMSTFNVTEFIQWVFAGGLLCLLFNQKFILE